MSVVRAYFDTNLFVYLYSDTEPEKRQQVLYIKIQYINH